MRPGSFHLVGLLFAMSLRMACAAAFGSGAAVMGRPITSMLAPAASANCGVAMRFWSPASEPAGRMPGVTSNALGTALRNAAASAGEQTIPSMPHSAARRASRRTCSTGAAGTPVSARAPASMLGRTRQGTGGFGRSIQHRPATGGVDGEQVRLEPGQRADGGADGVRNVVELEIEEDGVAALLELANDAIAACQKKLKAEFEP